MQIHVQTDKDNTKDCPCTFDGCPNFVRVNKFYAPAKAKCADHGGSAMNVIEDGTVTNESKAAADTDSKREQILVEAMNDDTDAPRLTSLRNVECMLCPDQRLQIIAINERNHVAFSCPQCGCTVELNLNFRAMQVRHVPSPMFPVILKFHELNGIEIDSNLRKKYQRLMTKYEAD